MADDVDPADYHESGRSSPTGQTFWSKDKKKVLLVTRGHPFARDAFYNIFESNPDIEYSAVEHPAAQLMFNPEFAKNFDCYVQYDMPGIEFNRDPNSDGRPRFVEPPQYYKDGVMAMLEAGFPLVIMHHTCAAWPAWPEWSEIVGGHFLYFPMKSRGVDKQDSGYNIDVPHKVSPVANHPITEGIEPFDIVDEVYMSEVFENSVVPLFRSSWEFTNHRISSPRSWRCRASTIPMRAGRIRRAATWSAGSKPTRTARSSICSSAMVPRPTRTKPSARSCARPSTGPARMRPRCGRASSMPRRLPNSGTAAR